MSQFDESFYSNGRELLVYPHEPPNPTKRTFSPFGWSPEAFRAYHAERKKLLPIERLLKSPPLTGGGITSQVPLALKITDLVRAGKNHPAQLVKVTTVGDFGKQPLLAKFYDPMLDKNLDNEEVDHEADPFAYADFSYSHEAAVYRRLSRFQGSEVPKYYGSYTCTVPLTPQLGHDVRLNLMEYVEGLSMKDVDAAVVPQAARKNIIRKVIEAESSIHAQGVDQRDAATRNFIIRTKDPASFSDRDLKVAMIDFGLASFDPPAGPMADLRLSPIIRWYREECLPETFTSSEWIDWDWETWLIETFATSKDYSPLTREALDWYTLPLKLLDVSQGPREIAGMER